MRKALVLVISALFFYGLFRDTSLVNLLVLAAAIAASLAISQVPERALKASKYPMIGATLALCPILFLYPWIRPHLMAAALVMFLSFHSLALVLVTMDDKGKRLYKEIIGLGLLYGTACANLFFVGHLELILPLSLAVLVFLFIVDKVRIMPFVAAWALLALILLLVAGVPIVGLQVQLHSTDRYVLIASAFLLFLFAFAAFIKRQDMATILAFFGLLYVSLDLLLSVGFRVKAVLLTQPLLALFVVGPTIGLAMRGGKARS